MQNNGILPRFLGLGLAAMAALAEADEGGVCVFELRLAALVPESLPFLLEIIDVVARSDGAGVVVSLGTQQRKLRLGGRGEGLHASAVDEAHAVAGEGDGVI